MLEEENENLLTQILRQIKVRGIEVMEEREYKEKGNEIARFSGVDRNDLQGWTSHSALNIAGKPKTFNSKQEKLRYAVGR